MNIERLTKLAELLDKVAEERKPFNLSMWVRSSTELTDMDLGDTAAASGLTKEGVANHECGTVACAVGHACLDPWFNEQGLTANAGGQPMYGKDNSWDAVAAFFEIERELAILLFDYANYDEEAETTAAEVAYRIRAFTEEETQS